MKLKWILSYLCFASLLSILTSCGKNTPQENPQDKPVAQVAPNTPPATAGVPALNPDPNAPKQFSVKLVPQKELNNYHVHIEWPDILPKADSYVINKSINGEGLGPIAQLPKGTFRFTDTAITPNKTYTYELTALYDNDWKTLGKNKVTVFPDLEIKGTYLLGDSYHNALFQLGRLVLAKDSFLYFEQRNIHFQVDRLIVEDGAKIAPFPENYPAIKKFRKGSVGLKAGSLILKAKHAVGNLSINMKGTDGQDADIAEYDYVAGEGGDSGKLFLHVKEADNFSCKHDLISTAKGGKGLNKEAIRAYLYEKHGQLGITKSTFYDMRTHIPVTLGGLIVESTHHTLFADARNGNRADFCIKIADRFPEGNCDQHNPE